MSPRQVGVPASDLGFYEWDGRTVEYHRAQVRKFLGFRECTVASSARSGTGRTATADGPGSGNTRVPVTGR
jgi:hypothetical protein